MGLYYVEIHDRHCQFSIELTLSNMAFYCDPITTRPLPRFSCCYKRTAVRKSSINLLHLYKQTVTYICSQLVYILEDIWQLMYINRHSYELRLRKVIINLVIRLCAITDGNPSVGSYGHVIVQGTKLKSSSYELVAAVPSGLSRHAWVILLFHWHRERRNSSDTVVIGLWFARSESMSWLLDTSRNISLLHSIESSSKYA